ncbi:MAG: CRISPR-associated protein Cas4 [Clostridia bacterium]|nr:CRISPR-associated protein Cas4 [Clostridia bacterium]
MEFAEEDFLMLSGIQHFEFCRRQWALIHIEQQWEENYLTVSGEMMHEKAHDKNFTEKRRNTVITRGMPIFSRTLGISGECDVVEFIRDDKNGIGIFGREGKYRVVPVEYKHGELKEADTLQLAAEAMCLEEMLCCEIPYGYLYYGKTRHREEIEITEELRDRVRRDFAEMHNYFSRSYTPKVRKNKSCNACSLKNLCLPRLGSVRTVQKYIDEKMME